MIALRALLAAWALALGPPASAPAARRLERPVAVEDRAVDRDVSRRERSKGAAGVHAFSHEESRAGGLDRLRASGGDHQTRGERIREELAAKGFELEPNAAARSQVSDLVRDTPARQRSFVEETKRYADKLSHGVDDPSLLRDERESPYVSVDNDNARGEVTTRDMDQLQRAERLPDGKVRVHVAITDVDALVPRGSPLDERAMHNGTSLYGAGGEFPMLDERVAKDLGSLLQGQERPAIVYQYDVDPATGARSNGTAYRALVRNQAELGYGAIGRWLDGHAPPPAALSADPALQDQLRLQDLASGALRQRRIENGALIFERRKDRAETEGSGVAASRPEERNRANDLVEDLMVASNELNGELLDAKGVPSLYRVLPEPDPARWQRIVQIVKREGGSLPATPDGPALARFLRQQSARAAAGTVTVDHVEELSVDIIRNLGAAKLQAHLPGQPTEGHFALAAGDYAYVTAPMRRADGLINQRQFKDALREKAARSGYAAPALASLAEHFTERGTAARRAERERASPAPERLPALLRAAISP